MKKSESRFFINWQLSKDQALSLYQATNDQDRTRLLEYWISNSSGLVSVADVEDESHWAVIL